MTDEPILLKFKTVNSLVKTATLSFPIAKLAKIIVLAIALADEPEHPNFLIGYTELRTNLPGGRNANVHTKRAAMMRGDSMGRWLIAEYLAD